MSEVKRNFRMTPADQAGYPGSRLWVVQYYDREMRAWFDVGDPLPKEQAQTRLNERRAEA